MTGDCRQVKDALLGGGKFDGDYSYTLTQDAGGHSAKARLRQRTEKCRQCEYGPPPASRLPRTECREPRLSRARLSF